MRTRHGILFTFTSYSKFNKVKLNFSQLASKAKTKKSCLCSKLKTKWLHFQTRRNHGTIIFQLPASLNTATLF